VSHPEVLLTLRRPYRPVSVGVLSTMTRKRLITKYIHVAKQSRPSLKRKKVSPHVLRHAEAMELLQHGVDRSVIARG
jgi:integrase/recombinase XerD